MVSSTDIPKATLNTKIVEGFNGIPKYPITPAVNNKGNILGINEIKIIRKLRNIHPINSEISNMAKPSDTIKFLIK